MLITGLVGNWILDRYLYLPVALIFAMAMISTRVKDAGEQPGSIAAGRGAEPDNPAESK
jgi:hypothetical protein